MNYKILTILSLFAASNTIGSGLFCCRRRAPTPQQLFREAIPERIVEFRNDTTSGGKIKVTDDCFFHSNDRYFQVVAGKINELRIISDFIWVLTDIQVGLLRSADGKVYAVSKGHHFYGTCQHNPTAGNLFCLRVDNNPTLMGLMTRMRHDEVKFFAASQVYHI